MNKEYARYLFVRAGILFFLVLMLSEYREKKVIVSRREVPDKVEVSETDELTEKREGYQSPVPFHQLWTENTEIIGWLFIEGSGINGPILQSEDNTKYLTAGYDGKANGHNMKNGSMFHDLINFKKESYFREHQEIIIYTPEKEICLQPIAVVCTEADGRRRITDFADRTEFQIYVAAMLEGGMYREVRTKDVTRLWSFVTCSEEVEDARTILSARECGSFNAYYHGITNFIMCDGGFRICRKVGR